jgi:hypothetical protein
MTCSSRGCVDFEEARGERVGIEPEQGADLGGGRQVLVELLFLQAVAEADVFGDERPSALALDDDPGVLELQVGALDRDDRDAQIDRKCPNRRDFLAWLPVTDGDAVPDLLDDLQVHGAGIRLRYCEHSGHINIHSVPNRCS